MECVDDEKISEDRQVLDGKNRFYVQNNVRMGTKDKIDRQKDKTSRISRGEKRFGRRNESAMNFGRSKVKNDGRSRYEE